MAHVRVEVSMSMNYWHLNHFKSLINMVVEDYLEEEIEKRFMLDFPFEVLDQLEYDYDYDSRGDGYGINIRIYPDKDGLFSFGISYTSFDARINVSGALTQTFISNAYFTGYAEGEINFFVRSYLFDMMYELCRTHNLKPYISVGFGYSPLEGNLSYLSEGTFNTIIGGKYYSASDSLNFDEIDDIRISKFPILSLNIGLKYYFYDNLNVYFDLGFFNGTMAKGGLSFYF